MTDIKAIAYYLPQFHPIPENDRWWGKGFTEWTNVIRARPFFRGHHQPQLPTDLGFYDLRLPQVREEQAALARRFGLYGFCYYYYWFNGKRLLELPLEEMLRTGKPDLPFCICWANENWTRRWDGAESEVLIGQNHSEESDQAFIRDVIPVLKDSRYIKIGEAPLLLVYRAGILPNPHRTTEIWREQCRVAGIPKVHLCAVQSFGLTDPRPLGFDSAVEFPPHGLNVAEIGRTIEGLDREFAGKVYDYRDVVKHALTKPRTPYRQFRGVMAGWDNTARRRNNAHIFAYATPAEYELWLRGEIAFTEATHPPAERFVFINAWNEWAEGAHLEPDQQFAYGFLEATSRALQHRTDWREILRSIRLHRDLPADVLREYVHDLEFHLEGYARSVSYLAKMQAVVQRIAQEAEAAVFSEAVPARLQRRPVDARGFMHLDAVQGMRPNGSCVLRRDVRTALAGWAFTPGLEIRDPQTESYLVLHGDRGRSSYFAPLRQRLPREDVMKHHAEVPEQYTANAGFAATVWLEDVPPGEYQLGVIHVGPTKAFAGFCGHPIEVK
jgi:lipopolysaccharide biosynthesis protein